MPTVSPKVSFWLGCVVTLCAAVSGGQLGLDHAIPADWIPTVKAWNGIVGFGGAALLTTLHAVSSREGGPLT